MVYSTKNQYVLLYQVVFFVAKTRNINTSMIMVVAIYSKIIYKMNTRSLWQTLSYSS